MLIQIPQDSIGESESEHLMSTQDFYEEWERKTRKRGLDQGREQEAKRALGILDVSAAWAALALALMGCARSGGTPGENPDHGLPTEHDRPAAGEPHRASDGGAACIALNGICGGQQSDSGLSCCAGTRCIERSVYDYQRCLVPYPKGSFCYRDDQCASGKCQGSSCAR